MTVLCGMPKIQYSAQRARLSAHKLFTSCIRRGLDVTRLNGRWCLPACDWVVSSLSAVLLIYSSQFRPAFLPCTSVSQPAQQRTWFTQYRTSDDAENLGIFLVRSVQSREWLWIDSNGKVETRNPVEAVLLSRTLCPKPKPKYSFQGQGHKSCPRPAKRRSYADPEAC